MPCASYCTRLQGSQAVDRNPCFCKVDSLVMRKQKNQHTCQLEKYVPWKTVKQGRGIGSVDCRQTTVLFRVVGEVLSIMRTSKPFSLPQGSDGQALGVEGSAF